MKFTFLLFVALASASAQQVKINEIQFVGTHNSYHSGISPNEMEALRKANPKAAESLDYRHPALETQLNDGVRQLEIDIYADARGGLFAHPKGNLPSDPPYDTAGLMMKPGFKVVHVVDVDYRSNCEPFTNCLEIVRNWSKAHPKHLPIFILVENKDKDDQLSAATFAALNAEILSVFTASELVTPDDVRGKHKTLNEAILVEGWPTLDRARGKVVFLLDQRRVEKIGATGVLFANATPGTPNAAFTECNDSVTDPALVPALIRKGYLVRTMTDGGPEVVKTNDGTRRDASIKSGAQILSTDYPAGEAAQSGFSVTVRPEGQTYPNARCNPVLKPANCSDSMLAEK